MFFYVLIFIAIQVFILLFSKIKINIQNIRISTEKHNNRNINEDYKFIISLYIFNKINLLKSEITKEKLDKLKIKTRIKTVNLKKISSGNWSKEKLKKINKFKPKIKHINLKLNIGLDDAALTSYSVAVISSILGIALKETIEKSKESKFIINPVYANKNLLNLELNCIIVTKMIHIIYIIYILNKKRRDDKYVRTSNRRAYGYSYE